jgi:hypothetical protein
MLKRFKPTLIAFLVLLLLLVYANYYEVDEIPEPGMEKPIEMVDGKSNEIDSITWSKNDKEILRIAKVEGKFSITVPGNYDVDKDEVKGVLEHFAALKSELTVAKNATDTSAFGINKDSVSVKISANQKIYNLTLGNKIPVGGSYYLLHSEMKTVFMVPGYIKGDFFKTASDFRNRQVFKQTLAEVQNIELLYNNLPLKLEKVSSIDWVITDPVNVPAEPTAVAALIQNFQNLSVSRFVEDHPEDLAKWGLKEPGFSISMKTDSGRTHRIDFGEVAGTETYFKVEGENAVNAVLNTDIDQLRVSVNDLRSRSLTHMALSDLKKIVLHNGEDLIELEKRDKDWFYSENKIDVSRLKVFLNMYNSIKIKEFLPIENLQVNKLDDPDNCNKFSFVKENDSFDFYFGAIEGVNLSLLHDGEILLVSKELSDSFKKLCEQILSNIKNKAVVNELTKEP